MAFVMRAHRRDDGGYDFTYGKSSKQLTAICQKIGKEWQVVLGYATGQVEGAVKIADVKAAWGALAEQSYGQSSPAPTVTIPPPPGIPRMPTIPRAPTRVEPTVSMGDVKFVTPEFADEGVATCPNCKQPFQGWTKPDHLQTDRNGVPQRVFLPPCRCNFPNADESYTPDPLDYRMYARSYDPPYDYTRLTPIGALDMVHAWMLRNPEYVKTDGKLDPLWEQVRSTLAEHTHYPEYRIERWQ